MSSSPETFSSNDSGALAEFRLRKPPFWLISLVLIVGSATLIPLAGIARGRFATSDKPRIHIWQDMGNQPKHIPQTASAVFADHRAARPVIEGTVTREAVLDDPHYTDGYTRDASGKVTFFEGFPKRVTVDERLLARGQQRFNIYCTACHGMAGEGNGMVHVRATDISNAGGDISAGTAWTQPANLRDETRRGRPEGHIFNTITNGIRNMGSLGHQISIDDRWAIVAYVRALQASAAYPAGKLPAEVRDNMK